MISALVSSFAGLVALVAVSPLKPGSVSTTSSSKIRNVISGAVTEKTFSPTEKFPTAFVERKDMQYLYQDGDLYYFMDTENYEQTALNADTVGDAMKFVKENEMCKVCSHNGSVFSVEPPLFVE